MAYEKETIRRLALFVSVCIVILALLALALLREQESPDGIEVYFNPGVSYEEASSLMVTRNLTIVTSGNTTIRVDDQMEIVIVMRCGVPEGRESEIEDYIEELRRLPQVYDAIPAIVECC